MANVSKPRRRDSLRLSSWDYASPAWYFVTICTHRRKLLLGEIVDERMQLNAWGEIVEESWKWLADQYAFVSLDDYVIMPNHLHGVIALHPDGRGGSRTAPTQMGKLHPGRGEGSRTARTRRAKPLGRLIGAFKTVSTKRVNQLEGTPGKVLWQRGFYDHIIRDDSDLRRIRRYIRLNPIQWSLDRYHP